MSKTIDFFFDFASPASFLGYTQIEGIAERTGAALVWKPMLLGGVFKATGNASPVLIPAKGRWMNDDIMRWAQRHGTSIIYPEGFPLNTLALMRGAVGYQLREGQERFRLYVDLIYRAIWQRQIDLRDAENLAGLLRDNGFDPDAFLLMVAEPEIKQALIAATEAAVERGVFGAPTFFVDGVMHFGQDRMDWVEAEASGN
ncbi:MAG: 2-hydroxychromene-2-carboxylate isomerase [Alphaproteobacteria bacterium]|nr:2-hydroxychromene-2-carboxylate isomerase [Alphaproteobacteria bacterium]